MRKDPKLCEKEEYKNLSELSFPDRKYQIIYADCPWSYRDKALARHRGAGFKYDLMTDKELLALPVADIADENCWLFFWVTFPRLFDAEKIIQKWGFKYRTIGFNWLKTNKKKTDTLFMGMGNYTRSGSEICLLAVKGKPKRVSASVLSSVVAPVEAHSKKPDLIRDRIVKLCGDVPRIELFARAKIDGWDCWGKEID